MANRLRKRVPLTSAETAFLDSLSAGSVSFRRRQMIACEGEAANEAFVLKSGWAMTFSDFPDGSRQVRRLHFPGDLLAMPSVAMRRHAENIQAVTDVVVSPFAKGMLATLFEEHPRLAGIMFIFAQQERITSGDRLCSLSRQSCKGRLAFLVLDVLDRLRAVDASIASSYQMHLTRELMAEITGMTPVHASRMWNELIAEGAIACEDGFVTVLDEARLASLSGYVNRAPDLDFDWLPRWKERLIAA